jgi:hypothetical protein
MCCGDQEEGARRARLSPYGQLSREVFDETSVSFKRVKDSLISYCMNERERDLVYQEISFISPQHYKGFMKTCEAFISFWMTGEDRVDLITDISKLNSIHYTNDFVKTCNTLITYNMPFYLRKMIILNVGRTQPHYYESFSKACEKLMKKCDTTFSICHITQYLCRAQTKDYIAFADMCLSFVTDDMTADESLYILEFFSQISPHYFSCMNGFLREHPRYFNYVRPYRIIQRLGADALGKGRVDTDDLILTLRLMIQNYNGTAQRMAYEIHDYSSRTIAGHGSPKKFNDAVMDRIESFLRNKPVLSFEDACLKVEQKLALIRLKSVSASDKAIFFRWIIQNIDSSDSDKNVFRNVVSFLTTKTDTLLQTWFEVFMDESYNAYQENSLLSSCIKGVRERVVTSLRNVSLPEFQDLFQAAEGPSLLKAKMAGLNNYSVWAKRMHDLGIRSTATVAQAKLSYERSIMDYFKDDRSPVTEKEISEAISNMMLLFDDMWILKIKPLLVEAEALPGAAPAADDE